MNFQKPTDPSVLQPTDQENPPINSLARRRHFALAAGCLIACSLAASTTRADVRLPHVLGDRMVVQRDRPLPVWGWAEPGEKVSVSLGGQRAAVTADDDEGQWKVVLGKLEAGEPLKMTVEGNNKIVLEDVLVGEVWFCSGQSNMEWRLTQAESAEKAIAAADRPKIRLLQIPRNPTRKDGAIREMKRTLFPSALPIARGMPVACGIAFQSAARAAEGAEKGESVEKGESPWPCVQERANRSAQKDETEVGQQYGQDAQDPEWNSLLPQRAKPVAAAGASQEAGLGCGFHHKVRAPRARAT